MEPKYKGSIADKRNPQNHCYSSSIPGRNRFFLQGSVARQAVLDAVTRLEERIKAVKQSWEDGFPSENFDEIIRAADGLRDANAQLKAICGVECVLEIGS